MEGKEGRVAGIPEIQMFLLSSEATLRDAGCAVVRGWLAWLRAIRSNSPDNKPEAEED